MRESAFYGVVPSVLLGFFDLSVGKFMTKLDTSRSSSQ
jgi:hypothetical protein